MDDAAKGSTPQKKKKKEEGAPWPPKNSGPWNSGRPAAPRQPEGVADWKAVKRAKQDKLNSQTIDREMLDPNGWSVPVRAGLEFMKSSDQGVCLVTTAEAKTAVK